MPENVLVPGLIYLAGDEFLDQLRGTRPKGLGIFVVEEVHIIADKAKDLGRLLGLFAPDLLNDALRAVLDALQSAV